MKLIYIYFYVYIYTKRIYIDVLFNCRVLHNPVFKIWQAFMLSSLYVFHFSIPDLLCSELTYTIVTS